MSPDPQGGVVVEPGHTTRYLTKWRTAGSSPGLRPGRSRRSPWRPWWKRIRPAVQVITVLGWVCLAAAVGCWVVAAVSGWREFTVIAVALLAALAVAALFLIGRSQFAVSVTLATTQVVVGEPASGRVEVGNTGSRRSLPVRLELPVGRGVGVLPIPGLNTGGSHDQLFQIPTDRRAVINVGPARSVRGDPFGLLRRVVRWTEPEVLYVHPRTVPLHGAAPGAIRDLEGQPTRDLTDSDVSLHALRAYVPGDDRRYIHWKSSAKSGALLVRQFEQTRRSHLLITVPLRRDHYADAAEFEFAVSTCASLAVQSYRDQRQVSVVVDRRLLRATSGVRLLDRLSELEITESAADVLTTAHTAAGSVRGASVAIILCGSTPTPNQLRAAGSEFAATVRVIVVRAVPGATTDMRSIGTITVLTVGELEDLGRALRKARA